MSTTFRTLLLAAVGAVAMSASAVAQAPASYPSDPATQNWGLWVVGSIIVIGIFAAIWGLRTSLKTEGSVGIALIAGGLWWVFQASQMDVTVRVCVDLFNCQTVTNLGLLNDKSNAFLLAGLTTLSGVILLAVASFGSKNTRGTAGTTIDQGMTDAAKAWRGIERSLGPEQYADFIAAFHGTPEAMLAAKHKRILQDWDALNKTDGSIVETFLASDLFPAMKERVRQFIAEEALKVPALDELNRRLLQQEETEKRLAREVEKRAEAAKREPSDPAIVAKKEHDRRHEILLAIWIIIGIIIGFVVLLALLSSVS
jgi:hypothetical protein